MLIELDGCRVRSRAEPDGALLVEISGELDCINADAVSRILCDGAARADLSVDLGEVRFVDSSGLRALVRGARSARDAGHALRLVKLTPRTSKLLEVAGLSDLLPVDE